MYNLIALSVMCPHCSTSLLDNRVMIDNEPSIRVNAVINGKKMWVRLSSVWESLNFQSEKPIHEGSHAEFSCPRCEKLLTTKKTCDSCGDVLAHVRLLNSGEVYFCSRRGCGNHVIEIDDIKKFLHVAQVENDLSADYPEQPVFVHNIKPKGHLMKTAYLDACCPHCSASLIEKNLLSLDIINGAQEKGILYMSPYLDVFSNSGEIEFAEKIEANDIKCRSCGHSLIDEDSSCRICSSKTIKFQVKAMSETVSFELCPARGCSWHAVSDEGLNLIFLEDSQEW